MCFMCWVHADFQSTCHSINLAAERNCMVPLSLWFGYKFNCWKVAEIVGATFQVNRLAAFLFVLAICKNSNQLHRHFFIDLFFHVNVFILLVYYLFLIMEQGWQRNYKITPNPWKGQAEFGIEFVWFPFWSIVRRRKEWKNWNFGTKDKERFNGFGR